MIAGALRRYAPDELLPGAEPRSDEASNEEAGNIATTLFHLVGTRRTGQDPRAVAGADLRVHGPGDCGSRMLRPLRGWFRNNTATPVVMIAEKVAEIIRGGVAT